MNMFDMGKGKKTPVPPHPRPLEERCWAYGLPTKHVKMVRIQGLCGKYFEGIGTEGQA